MTADIRGRSKRRNMRGKVTLLHQGLTTLREAVTATSLNHLATGGKEKHGETTSTFNEYRNAVRIRHGHSCFGSIAAARATSYHPAKLCEKLTNENHYRARTPNAAYRIRGRGARREAAKGISLLHSTVPVPKCTNRIKTSTKT